MAAKRLPNKPLADIAGKPMIQHVWERAMAADLAPVYVATDDRTIADVIEQAGGKAVLTRADHPSGSDRVFEAVETIDPQQQVQHILNLQGDLPDMSEDRDVWDIFPLHCLHIPLILLDSSLYVLHASSDFPHSPITLLLVGTPPPLPTISGS